MVSQLFTMGKSSGQKSLCRKRQNSLFLSYCERKEREKSYAGEGKTMFISAIA